MMKYICLLVVLLCTVSAFPSQNDTSIVSRKTTSGGIGHFCQIGEVNVITQYAACFDYCRLVEIKFGECPDGQVCCTTIEHVGDVLIDD